MQRMTLKWLAVVVVGCWSVTSLAGEGTEASSEAPTVEPPSVFPQTPPAGVPTMRMSTDFASPTLGFGEYQPMGQVISRGIRVAPFTVRAALQAGAGYDDNVTLRETAPVSSMFFTVNPSLSVGLEGATQRYFAVYRGNYGRYSSSEKDNYEDHNVGLGAANDWTTRIRTRLNYDLLRGHTPRGATATASSEPERWQSQSLTGLVSFGAEGAPGRIEADTILHERKYLTNRSTTAVLDYERAEVGATFFYRIAPKTRALAQVRRAEIDHPSNPVLDSSEMTYIVGATWQALAKTEGSAKVGYTARNFSNAAIPDFSGFTFSTNWTWSPLTYSIFDLSLARSLAESGEIGASLVVAEVATVVWSHMWPMQLASTVRVAAGRLSQEGLSRRDEYQAFAARLSYPLRQSLRVGAEIRHDSRSSDVPGVAYKRNITLITLETAL